jgi:hypothetical protein
VTSDSQRLSPSITAAATRPASKRSSGESAETDRASELLLSVLDLHKVAIVQLRTDAGVAYIRS